jgi:hypothetical protein
MPTAFATSTRVGAPGVAVPRDHDHPQTRPLARPRAAQGIAVWRSVKTSADLCIGVYPLPAQRAASPSEAGLIGVGMACTAGRTYSAKRRRLFSALCRGIPP